MAADTSSAPAASSPVVWPAAAALAALIVEPIPARSVAAGQSLDGSHLTLSGASWRMGTQPIIDTCFFRNVFRY